VTTKIQSQEIVATVQGKVQELTPAWVEREGITKGAHWYLWRVAIRLDNNYRYTCSLFGTENSPPLRICKIQTLATPGSIVKIELYKNLKHETKLNEIATIEKVNETTKRGGVKNVLLCEKI